MSCNNIISLEVEVLHDQQKNTLFNVLWRPPNCQIEPIENFLKLYDTNKNSSQNLYIAVDFNLNFLDQNEIKKVQNFLNITYQNGIISTINYPTSDNKKTAGAIYHIITKSYV